MATDRYFNYSALGQIVTDPKEDRIIAVNQEACTILGIDVQQAQATRISELFKDCFAQLIVFTQEAISHGRAWSDRLNVGQYNEAVEVTGRCYEAGEEHYLYLTIQRVSEIDRLRKKSDADLHYQSGIGHWNRVSRVFQEFERENQLLLDAAGEGIYGVDAKGNTTFVDRKSVV